MVTNRLQEYLKFFFFGYNVAVDTSGVTHTGQDPRVRSTPEALGDQVFETAFVGGDDRVAGVVVEHGRGRDGVGLEEREAAVGGCSAKPTGEQQQLVVHRVVAGPLHRIAVGVVDHDGQLAPA